MDKELLKDYAKLFNLFCSAIIYNLSKGHIQTSVLKEYREYSENRRKEEIKEIQRLLDIDRRKREEEDKMYMWVEFNGRMRKVKIQNSDNPEEKKKVQTKPKPNQNSRKSTN